jgi:hypothetical protein
VISNTDILKVFDVCEFQYPFWAHPYSTFTERDRSRDPKDVDDIQYITFLSMARAGLRGLEFYDPVTGKHGQAHMQARYVISMTTIRISKRTFLPETIPFLAASASRSILSKAVLLGSKKSEAPMVI